MSLSRKHTTNKTHGGQEKRPNADNGCGQEETPSTRPELRRRNPSPLQEPPQTRPAHPPNPLRPPLHHRLTITLADLAVGSTCREGSDLDLPSVWSEIDLQMLKVIKSILDGNFAFEVPSRAAANQLYVPELNLIVLKDKTSLRPYANFSAVRKATITARLLQLIHQLCLKNIHVTKRDLFYTDVKLFQDQRQSDSVLDDVSCILGCTRSSLNVIASEKGVVVGRLIPEQCTTISMSFLRNVL
ncbi:PREDICTED: meiotic recombination [Prunus dulcis]|uniref:PREDICTED: meiotic recombination n=1 Tax=Prunus dulcis TaxID=3755 RepID=A0A5E4G4R6_PRUDU|nr:DNA topoisomerase 6 subunit A-like [Prunus dulcis]KAI5325475.1 hypothetical protein L3X38_034549 [Prunus dulcis]VVA34759.1 PREDICTED: meiotic recombination [Prunus dulcis]